MLVIDPGLITRVSVISIIGVILLQGYFLYLAWKQSRVKNITEEQLRVLKNIDNKLGILMEKK